MSYALNYNASWISNEGLSKSIRIFRKDYTGVVNSLEVTNANLEFSKSDAPIDQVIKGKRFTLSVLTEGNNLRFFKDALRDEFIIIFSVDGKDRFSGFYENTGYFEKYGNDKYEIDLFFIDGFTFGKSLFYTSGTGDKLLLTLLNTIFIAIDPQAILKGSSTVEINENNNFFITINSVEYRYDFTNLYIRDKFFNGKSYYEIITELFGTVLSNVFYLNNKLYSFNLLNAANRFTFNKYNLNTGTQSAFTIQPTNYNNIEFTDGYVIEFTDSYSSVSVDLPYTSDSIILGTSFDLSESNFVATGTNAPDGNNYPIWDVNFLNNPDDTNIRVYQSSDVPLAFGDEALDGGFVFVDSQLATTGGLTDRINEFLVGGNIVNGSESIFLPRDNSFIPDVPTVRQYYLFYDTFSIRKGSYLFATYASTLNNIKLRPKIDLTAYNFTDGNSKLIVTVIPEIVLAGDNLYYVFDAPNNQNDWLTLAQVTNIVVDVGQTQTQPCYSALLGEIDTNNETTNVAIKNRIVDITATNHLMEWGVMVIFLCLIV
jgi:hypothetical protein